MPSEDQLEEREVLASIFPDEITELSENSYSIAIGIEVPPQALTADSNNNNAGHVQGEGDEDDDDGKEPTILLTVSLPPTYPTTAPSLSLSLPASSSPLPYLSLPTPDGPHLLSLLSPTIAENLGTAMIYTLLLTLKDLTEGLILERATAVQEAKDREKSLREEEEMRKFEGEKVDREVFERWRRGFRREMEGEERRRKEEREREEGGGGGGGKGKREGAEGRRLTGREMWERGLVGREEEVEEEAEVEDGERVVEGVESLRV